MRILHIGRNTKKKVLEVDKRLNKKSRAWIV